MVSLSVKSALKIVVFYSMLLFLLATLMALGIGLEKGNNPLINDFVYSPKYTVSLILLFLFFASWQSWNIEPNLPLKEKLFYLFTTLTIVFLPLDDFFIVALIPTLILYLFVESPKKMFSCDVLSLLWLLFLSIAFMGSFFSKYSLSQSFFMLIILLGYGFLFNIGRNLEFPRKYKEFYTTIFCGTVPVTILFGIFHMFRGTDRIFLLRFMRIYPHGFPYDTSPGLSSLLGRYPIDVAGFLIFTFVIILGLFLDVLNKKKIMKSVFLSLVLLIVFSGILMTDIQGVFLFFIGMGLLFLIFYPWKVFRRVRFIIVLISLLLFPLYTRYLDKWRETWGYPLQQNVITDYIDQVQLGISLLKEDILWRGVGVAHFVHAYYDYLGKTEKGSLRLYGLRNIYLSVLVETGILGFVLFMWVLFYLCFQYIKYKNRLPAYIAMVFFAGAAFYNSVNYSFYMLKFSILLFLFLGYCYPKNKNSRILNDQDE